LSGIESSASIYPALNGKAVSEGKELNINGAFTESSFLMYLDLRYQPERSSALEKPGDIVISKTTSEKFFGRENPIGKTLTMENGQLFVVTGVLDDPTGKSHINYDVYASMSAISKMEKDKLLPEKSTDWYAFNSAYTYALLTNGFSPQAMTNELNAIAAGLNKNNRDGNVAFDLQKITKITPGSEQLYNDIGSGTSWTKLFFEIGVALIILIAAC
jgi:putative ABC transport system permease protein